MRLTLLCALAVVATAEFARKSHFLNTVLGGKHTAQLGLTIDDIDEMLDEAHEQSKDGLKRTYVACSTLTDSAKAGTFLAEKVGEDNKQAVFSSRGRNMACWSIRATADEAKALSADELMQSVTVLPNEAKIHFNVLDYFEHEMHGTVASGKGWKSKPTESEDAVLKIEFGLGTSKGMHGIDMMEAVSAWRGLGREVNSLSTSASVAIAARGRWKNVQESTIQQHQSQSQPLRSGAKIGCDYSQLNIRTRKYTAEIRGLHTFGSSAAGMSCLARLVEAAAADHRVVRVIVTPEHKLLNNYARGITQSGTPMDEPFALTGEGQVVGVADSGLDDLSCFFIDDSATKTPRSPANNPTTDAGRRKVIQYVDYADGRDDYQGHGTHVCGSIAGGDEGNTIYNGMAPEAKLAFFDIGVTGKPYLSVPSLYDSVFPAAYGAGAHLHSNSWGSSAQVCDESCYEIDRYVFEHTNFTVLFAAGNDGSYGYFSIGNPALSKNCVAVGASEVNSNAGFNNDHMAFFSGIGPTFDNRIKPDVVAPGYFINSAMSSLTGNTQSCSAISMAGTSMATPVTAGNAALIRQYFEDDQFWAAECNPNYSNCASLFPSGALVKAMLISSAEPMAQYDNDNRDTVLDTQPLTATPDYFQGYGRVLLKNTLPVDGINDFDLYVLDNYALNSEDTIELEATITDTTVPLRVSMSWYDPPTTAYTSKQVLHDLDLLVVAPDGTTTYWGNGVEFGDEYNNNEKVFIQNPVLGTYIVKVHAYPLIASSSQEIALVITSGGSVTAGPDTGATWSYSQDDRDCAEAEVILNLIDQGIGYYSAWGLGKFLAVSDESDEIVYLGFSGKSLTETSMCLPKNACYTAQLSLAELYGTDDERQDSTEVITEIASCTYLLYQNVEEYAFCVDDDGACDYCHGDHEFNVEWKGTVSSNRKHRTFWLVYDVNSNGKITGERYGASAVSTATRKICLDDGLYLFHVPLAQNGVTIEVGDCNVNIGRQEVACVQVTAGSCEPSNACNDIDSPAPKWSGSVLLTCVLAVFTVWFTMN